MSEKPTVRNLDPMTDPWDWYIYLHEWLIFIGVSKNRGGPPKSSILIGFSIINHPFWGTPIFGNTLMVI